MVTKKAIGVARGIPTEGRAGARAATLAGHRLRPWSTIDPAIATVLRPALGALSEQTLAEIAQELPDLGSDLGGPYGEALRRGVEGALEHFLGPVSYTHLDVYKRQPRNGGHSHALLGSAAVMTAPLGTRATPRS